jgi:molybdopterin-containing oxidoreductase family iron-sulfur binding subunit
MRDGMPGGEQYTGGGRGRDGQGQRDAVDSHRTLLGRGVPERQAQLYSDECQHCDAAPCETVCPVGATYHNQDGLNAQIYNRCIGTRACAVYCPYEVRYFNYYDHEWDSPLEQQLNPDVTVRGKGVMEKCTFCIQRIRQAKDVAKDDDRRRVQDGEMQPACVQTCPTKALVFGDRKDHESQVYKSMNDPRNYRVLDELNTDSSVFYLKKVDA